MNGGPHFLRVVDQHSIDVAHLVLQLPDVTHGHLDPLVLGHKGARMRLGKQVALQSKRQWDKQHRKNVG